MTTTYVLYIEFDGGLSTASVHASEAEAKAAFRKFGAEFLAQVDPGRAVPGDYGDLTDLLLNYRLVDCRIFECAADGSLSDSYPFDPFFTTRAA
jgi:hypothetical protein